MATLLTTPDLVADALLPDDGTNETGGGASGHSTAANSRTTSVSGRSTPESAADVSTSAFCWGLAWSRLGLIPFKSRTTTTITTTEEGTGKEVTSVITHIGASTVASELNRDGSVFIRPVAARKGTNVRATRTHAFTPRISQFDRLNQGYNVSLVLGGMIQISWIYAWALSGKERADARISTQVNATGFFTVRSSHPVCLICVLC